MDLLFIAIISDRFPYPEFVRTMVVSVLKVSHYLYEKGTNIAYGDVVNSDRGIARNHMVEEFLERSTSPDDRILFMDTDMEFPVDFIIKLIEDDVDVVGGFYISRNDPGYPLVMDFTYFNTNGTPMYNPNLNIEKNQLVRCDATGAGCLMIKRKVLDQLDGIKPRKPFFHHLPPFEDSSEEMAFFHALRIMGVKVFVDTSVLCGHVYHKFHGWKLFDKMREGGYWEKRINGNKKQKTEIMKIAEVDK